MQEWIVQHGARVMVIFERRDTAGGASLMLPSHELTLSETRRPYGQIRELTNHSAAFAVSVDRQLP